MTRLSSDGNLAHHLVDAVIERDMRREELVQVVKDLFDHTLNSQYLCEDDRAKIIGNICWRFGLDPPQEIKDMIW